MSRAATTRTVGDQITTPAHGVYAHDGRARDGLAVRPSGAAAGPARCSSRSWSSKRRSDTSAASRACVGPPSCRRAKRSPRSMKAACRRRWCVACTSSPTATSSTTPPMSWRSACPASARVTRCAPSATRSSTAATPCSSCRPIASCRSSWRRSGISSCRAPYGSSITSRCCILDDVGLHPAESRGGRDSLHAPRRTLRATLRLHHQQSDLRALGSDLPRSDGDGRGDRSPGASLGPAGI